MLQKVQNFVFSRNRLNKYFTKVCQDWDIRLATKIGWLRYRNKSGLSRPDKKQVWRR